MPSKRVTRTKWWTGLKDRLAGFLEELEVPGEPGRFLPCSKGLTSEGDRIALGFSCFALKAYYTLSLWEHLCWETQQSWIAFLKSYQANGRCGGDPITENAFVDGPLMEYLNGQLPWRRRMIHRLIRRRSLTYPQRVIVAETKQAIAALAQVGQTALRPYRGLAMTRSAAMRYLRIQDWSRPWGAGAQVAALAVILKTQASRFTRVEHVREISEACSRFLEDMADVHTGAYFKETLPEHHEMVNGAMKVLTALDWLGLPIHYPEKLINTCLGRLPSPEGCHLVDSVYVLYRCSRESRHSRKQIQAYCAQVLEMIRRHQNKDGGFSYHIGRSQTHYYGVPISRGEDVSDIHGTCLLTWAVAMILDILDEDHWRIIRP